MVSVGVLRLGLDLRDAVSKRHEVGGVGLLKGQRRLHLLVTEGHLNGGKLGLRGGGSLKAGDVGRVRVSLALDGGELSLGCRVRGSRLQSSDVAVVARDVEREVRDVEGASLERKLRVQVGRVRVVVEGSREIGRRDRAGDGALKARLRRIVVEGGGQVLVVDQVGELALQRGRRRVLAQRLVQIGLVDLVRELPVDDARLRVLAKRAVELRLVDLAAKQVHQLVRRRVVVERPLKVEAVNLAVDQGQKGARGRVFGKPGREITLVGLRV